MHIPKCYNPYQGDRFNGTPNLWRPPGRVERLGFMVQLVGARANEDEVKLCPLNLNPKP